MNKNEMKITVNEELKKIPRDDSGHPQNLLRMTYNMSRRHQLSLDNPEKPIDTLQRDIEFIQNDHPDYIPDVDFSFFRNRK